MVAFLWSNGMLSLSSGLLVKYYVSNVVLIDVTTEATLRVAQIIACYKCSRRNMVKHGDIRVNQRKVPLTKGNG